MENHNNFNQKSRHNTLMSRNVAKSFKNFQSRDTCPNSRASSLLKRPLIEKLKFQIKLLKHLNHNSSSSFIFETLAIMSNSISSTRNEVIKRIMEEVQGKRAEQPEIQETTLVDYVRKEVEEVEGDSGRAAVFLTDMGQIFSK